MQFKIRIQKLLKRIWGIGSESSQTEVIEGIMHTFVLVANPHIGISSFPSLVTIEITYDFSLILFHQLGFSIKKHTSVDACFAHLELLQK